MIIEQLTSLLDDTGALEPWTLTDAELRDVTAAVHRVRAGLDEVAARLAGAAENRGLAREDGATSTTAWLANLTGISKRDASNLVSLSRAAADAGATRTAWSAGRITTDQAGIILRAVDTLPDWVGAEERTDGEQILLDHAAVLPTDDLRRLANHLIEVIDPDGAEELLGRQLERTEGKAWDATRLSIRDRGDGLTDIDGTIPRTQGHMLRTLLEAISAPRRAHLSEGPHSDAAVGHPDHAQRMGWALCEAIEHFPADKLPQAGGLAATITFDVSAASLARGEGLATTSSGSETSAREVGRLACNALLIPILLDGDAKILDINQAQRLHDRYQRIAIARRDGGCCWRGCDRPPAWCESHHLVPYGEGGPTTVDNGALFCFIHHHLLHDADWSARLAADGVVEVIPPARIDRQRRPLRHARHTKLQPRAA